MRANLPVLRQTAVVPSAIAAFDLDRHAVAASGSNTIVISLLWISVDGTAIGAVETLYTLILK